jgi:hypothetical protein
MDKMASIAASALVTGSVASIVSTFALAAMAKAEGKGGIQPTNATSHWLYGDNAARMQEVDFAHTGAGFATHHASAIFWSVPFEAWLEEHPPQSLTALLGSAAAVSALAAVVDYGITPKRFTPGWEHVLSKPSMVGAFGSLALGLALGAVVSRALMR